MSRVRKGKVYLTRRLERKVILTKEGEDSSQKIVLGVNIRTSPRITIIKLILRIKYPKILQHQKAGICLTTFLKILNKGNLSNAGNVKEYITPIIV